jgi:hypothetical protein
MKIPIFLVSIFALMGALLGYSQVFSNDELEVAKRTASQWTWGPPTNGIVGGIYVSSEPPEHKVEYWVYVHGEFNTSTNSLPPTFHSEPNSNAFPEGWFLQRFGDTNLAGTYFEATNYFCGPVVLRDSHGVEVASRNPGLVSPSAYPQTFNRFRLGQLDAFHAKMASPLIGRLPQLAKLRLEDLFEVKKPGAYVLTVWPKIYRQLRNDDGICERVDLLPISLEINWAKPPAN